MRSGAVTRAKRGAVCPPPCGPPRGYFGTSVIRVAGQEGAAAKGTREEFGEVARLFVEVDRGKDELDGPFGGEAFGFERVGKAKATDRQIWLRVARPIKLLLNVLPLGDAGLR